MGRPVNTLNIDTLFNRGVLAVILYGMTFAAPVVNAEGNENLIEEIVVTAQKREQALSDVPLSIQVADGEFLDRNNVQSLRELVNFVPGVATGESFGTEQTRIQIRGVPQIVGDPTVGYYIGETPFYFPSMLWVPVVRTSGLERVEIIKGPQSTLYGNGAMGGVMRVIPKKPNLEEVEVAINGGYTTIPDGGDGYYLDASASIPIIKDKLAVRISVGEEDSGGWIDVQPHALNFLTFGFEPSGPAFEDYGGNDVSDWRVQILAQPTERLTLELMAMHNESETTPTGFLDLNNDFSADATRGLTFDITEYDVYSATFRYDFDNFSVTSVFTDLEYTEDWQASLIGSFGLPTLVGYAPEVFSNETRVVSNLDGRFQYVAGIYYVDSENNVFIEVAEFPLFGIPQVITTTQTGSEQKSVFGEMTYELIEGRLTALIGARWFEDKREQTEATLVPVNTVAPMLEETFDSVNPRLNLSYTPDDDTLFYFNVAKGFRSGVFNSFANCSQLPAGPLRDNCPMQIDSDEIWSYEIGTKMTLAGGELVLDASTYYQDWTNVMGAYRAGSISTSYQLGDADGVGIDLGIVWSPESIPGLNVTLAANWNNMEFSSLDAGIAMGMAPYFSEGDGVPGTPDFSASLGANYGWQLSSNMMGDLTLSWNHKSSHVASVGATEEADNRQYLNARFAVEIGDHFTVSVFGNNLTDEEGNLFVQAGPLYLAQLRTIETPRNFGIELSYEL